MRCQFFCSARGSPRLGPTTGRLTPLRRRRDVLFLFLAGEGFSMTRLWRRRPKDTGLPRAGQPAPWCERRPCGKVEKAAHANDAMDHVGRGLSVSGTTVRPKEKKRGSQPGPGRPVGNEDYRTSILDAAEEQFAAKGYAGASLREISEKVGVNQALISYYFGSKLGLYEAVFLRRAEVISEARSAGLQALLESPQAPTVRQIVSAFLAPTLEMRATPGGRTFLHLQARLHTEPPEISYPLRRRAYDASTRAYADALTQALPPRP